jgi:hypothetical protein
VTEQELNGSQVAGAPVDHRRFGPPERVGAEQFGVQSDAGDPSGDKSCILARRHALAHAATAREQEFAGLLTRGSDGLKSVELNGFPWLTARAEVDVVPRHREALIKTRLLSMHECSS